MKLTPFSERARLGSSVILTRDQQIFGERSERKRLLTVDATKIWDQAEPPGGLSWALALSAEVKEAGPPGFQAEIVPAKARIGLGAGGITQWFEVDVFPSVTVRAPTPSITVEVFWDSVTQNDPPSAPFIVPLQTRIAATAHRSDGVTTGSVSFWEHVSVAPGPMLRVRTIPPFTDRFALRSDNANDIFLPTTTITILSGLSVTTGLPLLQLSGPQMLAIVQEKGFLPLPSTASIIEIISVLEPATPWLIEFGLAL